MNQFSRVCIIFQMIPIGARLAEMARIRLRYDEARRHVQSIQQVTGFSTYTINFAIKVLIV